MLLLCLLAFGCVDVPEIEEEPEVYVDCNMIIDNSEPVITIQGPVGIGIISETFLRDTFEFLSSPMFLQCGLGSQVGENVENLYCDGTFRVQRTNISGEVITSKECYEVALNELERTAELPEDYQGHEDLYIAWKIINMTCKKC